MTKDDVAGLEPGPGGGKGRLRRLRTGGDTWGKEGREGIPAKEKICVGGDRGASQEPQVVRFGPRTGRRGNEAGMWLAGLGLKGARVPG